MLYQWFTKLLVFIWVRFGGSYIYSFQLEGLDFYTLNVYRDYIIVTRCKINGILFFNPINISFLNNNFFKKQFHQNVLPSILGTGYLSNTQMFITRAYLSKNPDGPTIIFDIPVSVSIKEPTHILAMWQSVQGFVNKTEAYSHLNKHPTPHTPSLLKTIWLWVLQPQAWAVL